jgi:hypothetical protein
MADEIRNTPGKDAGMASNAFGEGVINEKSKASDPELVKELQGLINARAKIYARLRELTGTANPDEALARAREIVAEADQMPPAQPKPKRPPQIPDDRAPSTSIRTVSGGLPGLGKDGR